MERTFKLTFKLRPRPAWYEYDIVMVSATEADELVEAHKVEHTVGMVVRSEDGSVPYWTANIDAGHYSSGDCDGYSPEDALEHAITNWEEANR